LIELRPCQLSVFYLLGQKPNQALISHFFQSHTGTTAHRVSWLCLRNEIKPLSRNFCKTESNSSIFACIHKPNCGRARRVAHTKRQQCTYKPQTTSRVSGSTRHCLANQLALSISAPTNQSSAGTAKQLLLYTCRPTSRAESPASQTAEPRPRGSPAPCACARLIV
jgi:hypothetical protein